MSSELSFSANQQASVILPALLERDCRRFSISSIRSPVSMALKLATALRMLARETDILPVFFLRTMERLQNKMIASILTLGRPSVLPAIRRGSQLEVMEWVQRSNDNLGC